MFDPHNDFRFAAGSSDGRVQIFDTRITNKSVSSYCAHGIQETFFIDWHPAERGILLSGGQDQKIKAYNIEKNSELFSISTADQVCKTNWIPGRKYQVSSIYPGVRETKLSVWHPLKPNL
jgi:WD40 repeat protein